MFEWIDGHAVLAVILIPPFSIWAVGMFNGWLASRRSR